MTVVHADEGSLQPLGEFLADVRACMIAELAATPLGEVIDDFGSLLGQGKMLRSRMAYHLGPATGVPRQHLVAGCAAVEMIHAASLLHDDVIDGGFVRRGAPTFWVERGISGAILLGDLLLFKALHITCRLPGRGDWTRELVALTGEVCEAESVQELLLRGARPRWDQCVSIARRKTGALFAFVAHILGADDRALQPLLREAGYLVGTAYQLSDDILDVTGSEQESGKTLGTDGARDKVTAASAMAGCNIDPVEEVAGLCYRSEESLAGWPVVQDAWRTYLDREIRPALDHHLQALARVQASA